MNFLHSVVRPAFATVALLLRCMANPKSWSADFRIDRREPKQPHSKPEPRADKEKVVSFGKKARSAYVSIVALVGPNRSPSRRSHDSIDGAMVIARLSESAL